MTACKCRPGQPRGSRQRSLFEVVPKAAPGLPEHGGGMRQHLLEAVPAPPVLHVPEAASGVGERA
eukprot:10991929-Alexandrium_andersonii.AAC.1